MGLTDVMAHSEAVHVQQIQNGTSIGAAVPHVPGHSRESSISSTGSSSGESSAHAGHDDERPNLPSSPSGDERETSVLEARLEETRLELERSRAECGRLAQIRDDVEAEVRELTASLFQEAHVMVREANVKAAASEKALKEARMQVEVLQAEVEALKTLVLTSTPSQPNPHLHPQLSGSLSSGSIPTPHHPNQIGSSSSLVSPAGTVPHNGKSGGLKMFNRHRRGASDCDMKYQQLQQQQQQLGDGSIPFSSSPEFPSRPTSIGSNLSKIASSNANGQAVNGHGQPGEIDPVLYQELADWRRKPTLDREGNALIRRLFDEDADRCLDFPQRDLASRVRKAVEDNTIDIEEFTTAQTTCCALLETERQCRYKIKLGDDSQWHPISTLCRNRITAVCDMLTYLRYIQLGLVKSSMDDIYWEVMRLRKCMTLARLGLS